MYIDIPYIYTYMHGEHLRSRAQGGRVEKQGATAAGYGSIQCA
jgi:hypothetical protein